MGWIRQFQPWCPGAARWWQLESTIECLLHEAPKVEWLQVIGDDPLCPFASYIAEVEWLDIEVESLVTFDDIADNVWIVFPQKNLGFPPCFHVFSLPGPGLGLEPPGFPPAMGDAAARAAPPVGPPPPAPGLPQHLPCGGFGQLGLGLLGAEPQRWLPNAANRETTREPHWLQG